MTMLKSFVKNIISFYLNFLSLFFHKKGGVVLMYHSIGRNNVFSTVSPENFEKQLCFLKKNNFNVITLSDLWRFLDKEEPLPKKTIILTFDDGYYDNFSYGWPILKRYKFKATIFLTTGLVGGVKIKKSAEPLKMLSWQEIEKMQKSGIIDFQPHTQSHPRLTEISPELIQKEIGESKQSIEQALVKKAKEIGVKAEVFDFSVNKLPFSDKSFENVVLLDVLEHLYAPFDILKEAVRVSKQNIIIAAPNFNSIAARWQMLIGKTPENNQPKKGHIYWFNLNVLRGLLKQSGLEIIELKTNTIFEHRVLLKNIFQFLLNFFPNVFALSFVVKARQIYE